MAGLNDRKSDGGSLKMPSLSAAVGNVSNKELMREAREALSGNWGMAILGFVLYAALILSFGFFFYAALFFWTIVAHMGGNLKTAVFVGSGPLLQLLLQGAVITGFCGFFLSIAQDGQAKLECLFTGFRRFWTSCAAFFLASLLIVLWSLLLVVPGIIAAFRYAMVFFVIADDESCGPLEAIQRSKEMMKGRKWSYFCLHCRFIGWSILSTLTLNIGLLWLVPYLQASRAQFYENAR